MTHDYAQRDDRFTCAVHQDQQRALLPLTFDERTTVVNGATRRLCMANSPMMRRLFPPPESHAMKVAAFVLFGLGILWGAM